MAGLRERLAGVRRRVPAIDHALATQSHYGEVNGSMQAGGVTYFAFLSIFPVLALAVFVVGLLTRIYPDAQADLARAIDSVLPHMIGQKEGQISLDQVARFSGLSGLVGLAGVAYAGLGWVSALRSALEVVFVTPEYERPGFVGGKLRDAAGLALVGVVLLVSVAVPGFIAAFTSSVLGWLGLGQGAGFPLEVLARLLGLAANVVLLLAMFRLFGGDDVPRRALLSGALLGALAFELLKQLAFLLIAQTQGQPAFQAFGIALVLVVWINYFSRLVLYSASWAWTDPRAVEARGVPLEGLVEGPPLPSGDGAVPQPLRPADTAADGSAAPAWRTPFAAGVAAGLAAVALVRRLTRP